MNQHQDTMTLRVTARPFKGRVYGSIYDELFKQLTPQCNCIEGLRDKSELDRVSRALSKWMKQRNIAGKVRSTMIHPDDGQPGIWFEFAEPATKWKPAQPSTFDGAKPNGKK